MITQVYYQKWRPRQFDQVVGQQVVTQTLRQAIILNRVGHAYLFTGPRGTGKTSTARILAKAVNCLEREEGQGEPCGRCSICSAVDKGSMMDLIEIDAASNRGIDEIRNLREKAHFAPSEARHKVYIIDEVHMLTKEAFNAFLKTLEEPPTPTIFLLATTEPQKLPATIISRCQRFDFRRISTSDIVERLDQICREEGVEAAKETLRMVARSAGGSLRDAENLLEQLATAYGGRFEMEQVRDLLGLGGDERALALVKHMLSGDTTKALQVVNDIASDGLDIRALHRQIMDYLRAAMLIKSGARDTLEQPNEVLQELSFLTTNVSLERMLNFVKLFGAISLRYDNPSPLPLELAVVEATIIQEKLLPPARPSGEVNNNNSVDSQMPVSATDKRFLKRASEDRTSSGAIESPSAPAEDSTMSIPEKSFEPAEGRAAAEQEGTEEQEGLASTTPPRAAAAEQEGTEEQEGLASTTPPRAAAAEQEGTEEQEGLASTTPPTADTMGTLLEEQWPAILKALNRQKGRRFFLGGLLRDCVKREIANGNVVLWFAHRSHMERFQDELDDPGARRAVQAAFQKALGGSVEIKLELEAGGNSGSGFSGSVSQGHMIRAALGMGGKIIRKDSGVEEEEKNAE
jgi:DNA polymerase-3 subunit gamma/tau